MRGPPLQNSRIFVTAALLIGLALALLIGPLASSSPDGLEKVAEQEGFADVAADSAAADGPLADYGIDGVDDESLSTAFSGAVGVLLTFGLAIGLFGVIRTLRPDTDSDDEPDSVRPGAS